MGRPLSLIEQAHVWPWIRCDRRMPSNNAQVQAWDTYGNWYPRVEYRDGIWRDEEITDWTSSKIIHNPITHWMEQPAPPPE